MCFINRFLCLIYFGAFEGYLLEKNILFILFKVLAYQYQLMDWL